MPATCCYPPDRLAFALLYLCSRCGESTLKLTVSRFPNSRRNKNSGIYSSASVVSPESSWPGTEKPREPRALPSSASRTGATPHVPATRWTDSDTATLFCASNLPSGLLRFPDSSDKIPYSIFFASLRFGISYHIISLSFFGGYVVYDFARDGFTTLFRRALVWSSLVYLGPFVLYSWKRTWYALLLSASRVPFCSSQ
ncbi:hypothetical protein BDW69DRAFT_95958 [Aspergillus filifer]